MVSGFDLAATAYDTNFTYSPIGRLQRKRVYKYLDRYLATDKKMNILELNCGTGEDALYMAENGHNILATDLSGEMLHRAKNKTLLIENIQLKQLDINHLREEEFEPKPDLIFSNFGGLNCISKDQIGVFLKSASDKLEKSGLVAAVIMSKKCLWERLYFLLKMKSKEIFRRNSPKSLKVPLNGKAVRTWYYDPDEISKMATPLFSKVMVKPIGFLIPPSYLNSFFKNKKKLLNVLAWLENKVFSFEVFSAYSDHYIIVLKKR